MKKALIFASALAILVELTSCEKNAKTDIHIHDIVLERSSVYDAPPGH